MIDEEYIDSVAFRAELGNIPLPTSEVTLSPRVTELVKTMPGAYAVAKGIDAESEPVSVGLASGLITLTHGLVSSGAITFVPENEGLGLSHISDSTFALETKAGEVIEMLCVWFPGNKDFFENTDIEAGYKLGVIAALFAYHLWASESLGSGYVLDSVAAPAVTLPFGQLPKEPEKPVEPTTDVYMYPEVEEPSETGVSSEELLQLVVRVTQLEGISIKIGISADESPVLKIFKEGGYDMDSVEAVSNIVGPASLGCENNVIFLTSEIS